MRTFTVFLALPALIAHVAAIAIEGPQALNQLSKRADPTFEDWPEAELPKKQKLETALFDAYMLVSYAQEHYDSFKYIWDKYFPESEHEKIKALWKGILPDPSTANGDEKLKSFVILGFDFRKDVRDHCGAEGADAYTTPVPDFISPIPQTATYFCPKAFELPATKDDLRCVDLGDTLSTKMDFLGATILHEWMHNDQIGKAAMGVHIEDLRSQKYTRLAQKSARRVHQERRQLRLACHRGPVDYSV